MMQHFEGSRESREIEEGVEGEGGAEAGCFFGEECVAAAEPSSHGRVLYQPVAQPCTAPIKLCTVGLLDKIVRHHAAGGGVWGLWGLWGLWAGG